MDGSSRKDEFRSVSTFSYHEWYTLKIFADTFSISVLYGFSLLYCFATVVTILKNDCWETFMELDYKAIGKRIKIARIGLDLTQEQLADKVSLSPTHMSNVETGTTKVSLTTIVKIANALGVTVDDLLCDNLLQARPQFERDMQALLDSCEPYEVRIAYEVARAAIETVRANEKLKSE